MGTQWWHHRPDSPVTVDRVKEWIQMADEQSSLVVVGVTPGEWESWSKTGELGAPVVHQGEEETLAIRWDSLKDSVWEEKRQHEHRELLKILQEALYIEQDDSDLAARLAARAYVNLKTDPVGQRRYDGLLHRFTGVLHKRPTTPPSHHT